MTQNNRRDYLKYLGFKVAFAQTSLKELKTNPPPMTQNDKLPHGIEIKIDFDSNKFAEEHPKLSPHIAYRAGATTWALWKLKHDEVKADFKRVQKNAIHYANRKDEVEKQRDEVQAQARQMADALEKILKQHTYYDVIELAANALQQFKDGTKGRGNEG